MIYGKRCIWSTLTIKAPILPGKLLPDISPNLIKHSLPLRSWDLE